MVKSIRFINGIIWCVCQHLTFWWIHTPEIGVSHRSPRINLHPKLLSAVEPLFRFIHIRPLSSLTSDKPSSKTFDPLPESISVDPSFELFWNAFTRLIGSIIWLNFWNALTDWLEALSALTSETPSLDWLELNYLDRNFTNQSDREPPNLQRSIISIIRTIRILELIKKDFHPTLFSPNNGSFNSHLKISGTTLSPSLSEFSDLNQLLFLIFKTPIIFIWVSPYSNLFPIIFTLILLFTPRDSKIVLCDVVLRW